MILFDDFSTLCTRKSLYKLKYVLKYSIFSGSKGGTDYFEWNYVKPWCRFSPYIIGLVLGYILHVTKKKPIKLNHVRYRMLLIMI